MTGIHDYMTRHHAHCDALFTQAETEAMAEDWAGAKRDCTAFLTDIARHMDAEENVLFPLFEARTGITGGPTHVMRTEHTRMKEIFDGLLDAIGSRDATAYRGHAAALKSILNAHNMKEESVLYPMLDQIAGAERDSTLDRVKALMEEN